MKTYTVCSSYDQASADSFNHCAITQEFDTLKAAKEFARRTLTDEYQALIEASAPMNYAKVECNGECLADYFRKGCVAPVESDESDDIPAGDIVEDSVRHLGEETPANFA